jgi:hypothetical protein
MRSLDEIEAGADAATPGPWTHGVTHDDPEEAKRWIAECYDKGAPGPAHMALVPYEGKPLSDEALVVAITGNGPTSKANVAFITHARTDVPALVDRVRELEAENAESVQVLDHCREWFQGVVRCATCAFCCPTGVTEEQKARMTEHVAECEKHPAHLMVERIRELRAALEQAHLCPTVRPDGACDGCAISTVLDVPDA